MDTARGLGSSASTSTPSSPSPVFKGRTAVRVSQPCETRIWWGFNGNSLREDLALAELSDGGS